MAVVVDASAIVALADASAPEHEAIAQWVDLADEELVLSPLAAARADDLLRALSDEAGAAFAADLASGAYVVRWWADAMNESAQIVATQGADLVDASSIAVAARVRTNRILTTRPQTWHSLSATDGENFEIVTGQKGPLPQLLESA